MIGETQSYGQDTNMNSRANQSNISDYMRSYKHGLMSTMSDLKTLVFSNLNKLSVGSVEAQSLADTDVQGRTLFHRAADSSQPGDLTMKDTLRKLTALQPGLIDQRNNHMGREGEGDTPLLTAINRPEKNGDFINMFTEVGADVNAKGISGHTPLIRMIVKRQPLENIERLLSHGNVDLDVNVPSPSGRGNLDLDWFISHVRDPEYKELLQNLIEHYRTPGSEEKAVD